MLRNYLSYKKTNITQKTFLKQVKEGLIKIKDAEEQIKKNTNNTLLLNQKTFRLINANKKNIKKINIIKKDISYEKISKFFTDRKHLHLQNQLRKLRKINKETMVITQNTTGINKNSTYNDIIDNENVKFLNKNFINEINKAIRILHKYKILNLKISLAYISINDTTNIQEKIKDEDEYKNITNYAINPFNDDISNFNIISDNEKTNILNFSTTKQEELKNKFELIDLNRIIRPYFENSGRFVYFIVGYNILINNQQNINFNDYVNSLKAYSPSVNQLYHKLTSTSTTMSRMCIYQTFYYLYIKQELIKKNEIEINEHYNMENDDIIKEYVKKGELLNFLMHKKVNNEEYYVKFYRPNNKILGFKLTINNEIIELYNDSDFYCKKIFLYDNMHVAPLIYLEKQDDIDNNIPSTKKKFYLKPEIIKKKTNKTIIYSFDIETYLDENNKAIPYALCMTSDNIEKKFYGDRCIHDFVDYIDSICTIVDISKTHQKKKIDRINIYGFNNSNFDNILIFDELYRRNPSLKYIISGSSIKSIKYHNVKIFDLRLFYNDSLKNVSKAFKLNLQKGVFPYKFVNKNNLNYNDKKPDIQYWNSQEDYDEYKDDMFDMKEYTLKYCILDCKITEEIAKIHYDQCKGQIDNKNYDTTNCSTGASVALKIYTQIFLNETLYGSPEEILYIERNSYKGGRTEVFKKKFTPCTDHKHLYYYDINSSYPYAMLSDMPVKFMKHLKFNEIKLNDNTDMLFDHFLYRARCTYRGNDDFFIPNLLIRSSENDIIANKNTEYAYHWGVELRHAIELNCDIYINEQIEYKNGSIFNQFANYMYNERLIAKKNKNSAKSNYLKLCMNSLYGKFAQTEMNNNVLCQNSNEINRILNDSNNQFVDFEIINEKILIKYKTIKNKDESVGNLVRFSSYITAIARTNLAKFMHNVEHKNVYYCDTDSVFTSKKPSDDSFIDQTQLGKWKQETKEIKIINIVDNTIKRTEEVICNIKSAIFLSPKSYFYDVDYDIELQINEKVLNTECYKAKGMPNDKLTTEIYEKCLNDEKCVLQNETMFFRSLENIHIRPQNRTLTALYNKRIFNEKNESTAYNNYTEWHENKYQDSDKTMMCVRKIFK